MDFFYFLIRHTPFWAIPAIFICVEFTYLYWLKGRKAVYACFVGIASWSFLCLVFYYWAGGPEAAVGFIIKHTF